MWTQKHRPWRDLPPVPPDPCQFQGPSSPVLCGLSRFQGPPPCFHNYPQAISLFSLVSMIQGPSPPPAQSIFPPVPLVPADRTCATTEKSGSFCARTRLMMGTMSSPCCADSGDPGMKHFCKQTQHALPHVRTKAATVRSSSSRAAAGELSLEDKGSATEELILLWRNGV